MQQVVCRGLAYKLWGESWVMKWAWTRRAGKSSQLRRTDKMRPKYRRIELTPFPWHISPGSQVEMTLQPVTPFGCPRQEWESKTRLRREINPSTSSPSTPPLIYPHNCDSETHSVHGHLFPVDEGYFSPFRCQTRSIESGGQLGGKGMWASARGSQNPK